MEGCTDNRLHRAVDAGLAGKRNLAWEAKALMLERGLSPQCDYVHRVCGQTQTYARGKSPKA